MTPVKVVTNHNILHTILDENRSPVARMRLISGGVNPNNRVFADRHVTGDRGCLACGNCVDACPVVRDKQRFVFLQNQRTSMALENIVADECRRCYDCVRNCPQVGKSVKEYVLGFRRAEKIVHTLLAGFILTLIGSGVLRFHFGEALTPAEDALVRGLHITGGLALLLVPAVYALLDRSHFTRMWRRALRFGSSDLDWFKRLGRHLLRPDRQVMPYWGEFSPYQRFWYLYVTFAGAVLGATGIAALFASLTSNQPPLTFMLAHIWTAFVTDILVLLHIYMKYGRNILKTVVDIARGLRRNGSLHYPFIYDNQSSRMTFHAFEE